MDAPPDYAELSRPTADLGIDPEVVGAALAALAAGAGETAAAGRPAADPAPDGPAPDEPLVDASAVLRCVNCYHAAGWPGTSPTTWLRRGVLARLATVSGRLPDGFGLAVFDGWRSPTTIRALYEHYYGPDSTLAPGFLADPDAASADAPPPPHVTGGAVDMTLTWHDQPLSLGTPFDEFTARAHLRALEGSDETLDRDLRRLLHTTLTAAGFVDYDQEWWHYSFGDDAWAAATGRPVLYGATSPNR